MPESLSTVVDFVEGRIGPLEFQDRLYQDDGIEKLLANDPNLQRGTYVGSNVYLYLLEMDYSDPRDALNAHGALCEFLARNNIPCKVSDELGKLFELVLDAQPSWLDVPPKFIQELILSEADGRTGKKLSAWLRSRLLELFRFASKPPVWIQSPDWPIAETGPMVFLGQLSISGYFHDEAAAYVFHDPETGSCETLIQVS